MKNYNEIDVLIEDLNKFYVELTGECISQNFEAELRKSGAETIMALVAEKKHAFSHALYCDLDSDIEEAMLASYRADMECERCDDPTNYRDPFVIESEY
jgi:hypothetical protein